MPIVLPPSRQQMSNEPAPKRKRWTRKECEFLVRSELLTDRYELIDGEIITLMGQNRPHVITTNLILEWLRLVFGGLWIQGQQPVDLSQKVNTLNEPEPDIAVLTEPWTFFTDRHPGPGEVVLVVEVSDSTLTFDLHTKALLYAQAGFPEYWVADVTERRMVVHRNPTSEGYQEVTAYAETERLSPLARPDVSVQVSELFPPM